MTFSRMPLVAVVMLALGGTVDAQNTIPCDTVLKCAQAAVEAAQLAQQAAASAIPAGAVMAFRLQNCPVGWVPATNTEGRVIVGAGGGGTDVNSIKLTDRKLGDIGGEEAHKLTLAEMPSHGHSVPGFVGTSASNAGSGSGLFGASTTGSGQAGSDQPHNTMPPFIVLTYCEKK